MSDTTASDTDLALRLAIADAAVAYVERNARPFTAENVTAWERLETAVVEWRKAG